MLDVFALFILCVLVVAGVVVFLKLAMWPKAAAVKRNHPQVDAINLLAWLGLFFTAGVGWIVAVVWAHAKPVALPQDHAADLQDRISKLEAEVAALRGAGS